MLFKRKKNNGHVGDFYFLLNETLISFFLLSLKLEVYDISLTLINYFIVFFIKKKKNSSLKIISEDNSKYMIYESIDLLVNLDLK